MSDLVTPMALRVAATLRVADHLARGPRSADQLAQAAGVDSDGMGRLLRHLGKVGVLSRDDEARYALTADAEPLRDDHRSGLRTMLDVGSAVGRADLCLVQLLHSVRTGEAAFPVQFGNAFWEDLDSDPHRRASFDVQMGRDVAAWAPLIVEPYDWGSLGHVVDVGGGNGTLLAALLEAHPGLQGTVFDQRTTVEAARKTLAEAGLSDRATVASGSFFDPLPPGAGGYLLSAVLHDWDDAAARAILRRCADAAGTEGTVFVVEKTGADGESPSTEMDLRLLAYFAGRQRGVAELSSLAMDVGLHVAAVHPAADLSIIELTAS
jgi:hypothetical protein